MNMDYVVCPGFRNMIWLEVVSIMMKHVWNFRGVTLASEDTHTDVLSQDGHPSLEFIGLRCLWLITRIHGIIIIRGHVKYNLKIYY